MPYNAKDLQTRFQALDLPNGVTVGVNEDGLVQFVGLLPVQIQYATLDESGTLTFYTEAGDPIMFLGFSDDRGEFNNDAAMVLHTVLDQWFPETTAGRLATILGGLWQPSYIVEGPEGRITLERDSDNQWHSHGPKGYGRPGQTPSEAAIRLVNPDDA